MPSSACKKKTSSEAASISLITLSLSRPKRTTSISCFLFNDTATTEIYTLSLHDALPISSGERRQLANIRELAQSVAQLSVGHVAHRSEEHTSELQSRPHLVCRLLLE